MNNWFLHNGLVYHDNALVKADVLVVAGEIVAVGADAHSKWLQSTYKIQDFDATDYIISPGFIDLHTHLREPGFESKETITTGTQAAAAGGFTTVFAMPNTNPVLDSLEHLAALNELIAKSACVKVKPIAALTRDRVGVELNNYAGFIQQGINFFSDDGDPLSADVAQVVMEQLAELGGVVINHLEDKTLVGSGFFAAAIPPESEYLMLLRDLEIVAKTGCRYHAAHLSCAQSVDIVAKAKAQGLPVTAEVTPHQLTLTTKDIKHPEGYFQMKPPLRSTQDRMALIKGVRDGVIDVIATDHAPHGREKVTGLYAGSPFGVTGLETAFSVLYTQLVLQGELSLERLLQALTTAPGEITGLPAEIKVGNPADIVVLNLQKLRTVEDEQFFSKGTNSPYVGAELQGWPIMTLVNGEARYTCPR